MSLSTISNSFTPSSSSSSSSSTNTRSSFKCFSKFSFPKLYGSRNSAFPVIRNPRCPASLSTKSLEIAKSNSSCSNSSPSSCSRRIDSARSIRSSSEMDLPVPSTKRSCRLL